MSRPIDADEMKKQIESGSIIIDEDVLKCKNIDDVLVYLVEKVEQFMFETIDTQPTINPEDLRLKGKWIEIKYTGDAGGAPVWDLWECSECGRQEYRKEPYCHCGAKMEV